MNIEKIAGLLSEELIPGETGMVNEADGNEEPSGDLGKVETLAQWCMQRGDILRKHARTGDVRQAQLVLIELEGVLQGARKELDMAAKMERLPPLPG